MHQRRKDVAHGIGAQVPGQLPAFQGAQKHTTLDGGPAHHLLQDHHQYALRRAHHDHHPPQLVNR